MRTQGSASWAVNWEKSKLLPTQRISFLGMEFGFGQSDSAPHAGTHTVCVELLEYVQEQDGGTPETVSEAPGAYGGCGGSYAAGAAPYETASTLAPWPSPEVGVAERHAAGPSHSSLPPNLHPVVRPFVPLGRSAPGTGLQARCGLHRCLRQGLGGHVQRACSVGGLDGSPTTLTHKLLAIHLALNRLKRRLRGKHVLVRTDSTATIAYINRQGDIRSRRMSQLARHLLLWSRKHLRSLRAIHIYSGLAQPDSRQAVTSARSESYCPSCSNGWSEGCLPPSLTPMWLRLLPTTTPWMGSWWGSMTGSSGSLGEREGWILHGPPLYPLGTCL